ncbi:hypothetical protein HDU80_003400 [Chytriomyces hyalinus]|nr:hypothetical protein HDU80_003400 [Chytriomyces hyalinus]
MHRHLLSTRRLLSTQRPPPPHSHPHQSSSQWTPFPSNVAATARPKSSPHKDFNPPSVERKRRIAAFAVAAILTGGLLGIAVANTETDAVAPVKEKGAIGISSVGWAQMDQVRSSRELLGVWIWGRDSRGQSQARFVEAFRDVPLRDLAIDAKSETNVAIDASGNLLLSWNDSSKPFSALAGANLTRVVLSNGGCLSFALSKTGEVFRIDLKKLKAHSANVENSAIQLAPQTSIVNMLGLGWLVGARGVGAAQDLGACQKVGFSTEAERITSISSGESHLLALSSSGKVYTAPTTIEGNKHGQLGGTNADPAQTTLSPVPTLKSVKTAQIAAGTAFNCIRTANGQVFTWGSNKFGQLGTGRKGYDIAHSDEPLEMQFNGKMGDDKKCTLIAAGGDTVIMTLESKESSEVFSVGMGQWGQLGTGNFIHMTNSPVKVATLSNLQEYSEKLSKVVPIRVDSITMGPTHVVAVLKDGSTNKFGKDVFVWGGNEKGQLGRVDGKKGNSAVPVWVAPVLRPIADQEAAAVEVQKEKKELTETEDDVASKPPVWEADGMGRLQVAGPGRAVTHHGGWTWTGWLLGSTMPQSVFVEQAFACADGVTALYSKVL